MVLSASADALLKSMIAPPSGRDLPGELVATTLSDRDAVAYLELLVAGVIVVGVAPVVPSWIWAHYAENYLTYTVKIDQYDAAVTAVLHLEGLSFHGIATITDLGWSYLALSPTTLPAPLWGRP